VSSQATAVGCVVIGRNEGERLGDSLRSVLARTRRVVYADSGSTDGSREAAESLGVRTVALDPGGPMSAARGRNAGFQALREHYPECDFVQFLDGDCILTPDWIDQGLEFLLSNPRAAVVCGRRFEAAPGASLYNGLMDREWDTPVGRADACGGDSLVRIAAFDQVGGFRSNLTAGEEPELCARLRAAGWEIWRLDAPMSEHDANIHRFGQWWRRAKRSGFGYAQVWQATRSLPRRLYGRELARAFLWAVALPLLVIAASMLAGSAWLLLLLPLIYGLQVIRIALRNGFAWRFGLLMVTGKFAEAIGAATFFVARSRRQFFDYKSPANAGKLEPR